MNYFPASIIDNFFDNPEAVVELAKSIDYHSPKETIYPGVISSDVAHTNYELAQWIISKVMNLFYDLDKVYITWDSETTFQKIKPYDNEDQFHILNRGVPHIDVQETVLAGVIYLNENFCKDAGTSFYQKKLDNSFYKTSKETIDANKKYHGGTMVDNYEQIVQDHFNKFEETVRIQPKFNRLVMYSPDTWHSQTTYGKDEERLTLRFFVNMFCQEQAYPLRRYYE